MIREIEEAVWRLRQCAKPIVFDSGNEGFPYATWGTGFLVKLGAQLFFVTANHVLGDMSLDKLLVFPNAESDESIPFSEVFTVANRDPADPDSSDLVILKTHLGNLRLAEQSCLYAIDLDVSSDSWRTAPP